MFLAIEEQIVVNPTGSPPATFYRLPLMPGTFSLLTASAHGPLFEGERLLHVAPLDCFPDSNATEARI